MLSLNKNELEALRILWDESSLKPAEIQERFSWEIDNGTLRSALSNLIEKGHISRKLRGKAYLYSARVPKHTLLKNMMSSLARIFSGGSAKQLMAQLVETGDIKPSDLKFLTEAAQQSKKPGKKAS
jgi:predicted transcriptional regulator